MIAERKLWIVVEAAVLDRLHDLGLDRSDRIDLVDRALACDLVHAGLDALGLWPDGWLAVGDEAIAKYSPSAAMGRLATTCAVVTLALGELSYAGHRDSIALGVRAYTQVEGAVVVDVKWLMADLRRRKTLACPYCLGAGGFDAGQCGHCSGTGDRDESCTFPACEHEPRV